MPLPLRYPRPGETASAWLCRYCGERFLAVLDDRCPPMVLANVDPAEDVNPRVIVAGVTLETMHKRIGTRGRVLTQRREDRRMSSHGVTIIAGGQRMEVVTLDLSAGGFSFVSNEPLTGGTEVMAQFHRPPKAPPSRCAVCYCTAAADGKHRIGVAFITQP